MSASAPNYESGSIASYRCGAAIPANRLVKYDSVEGQIVVTSAITDVAIGVSISTGATGDIIDIQTAGVAKLATSAAVVALGAQVMPAAAGAGVCATTSGATSLSVGLAESAGGGTLGELIRVRLKVPNVGGPVNV